MRPSGIRVSVLPQVQIAQAPLEPTPEVLRCCLSALPYVLGDFVPVVAIKPHLHHLVDVGDALIHEMPRQKTSDLVKLCLAMDVMDRTQLGANAVEELDINSTAGVASTGA